MPVLALTSVYGITDVAIDSIQFDLAKIGESIYEAHARDGRWPARISDLDGTVYLNMPYRRHALETGAFVAVWQHDLAPDPAANRDRVLAYDAGSLFARFGWVWACWGDLRIARVSAERIAAPAQR